jgi:hypothetical protein
MAKKIVKVIYTDETEDSVKDLKTIQDIKKDFDYDKDWKTYRHYERQFQDVEKSVLWNIDDDVVREYAKDYLDLKDEDENDCDCDETDISDFEDAELMAEMSSRNLLGFTNVSIVSIDLFTRFSRIITFGNNAELESIITDLEKKYNL